MAKKDLAKDTAISTPPMQLPAYERDIEKSPGYVSLYANDVQVQTTPWDMRLILGEILDLPTTENAVMKIKQLGELRVSPQLAKKLAMVMMAQLRSYEEHFGEIPLAKDS